MAAPVAVTAALVKARTGRRIVVAILALVFLGTAFLLTPLIAIPFAIVGQSAAAIEVHPQPVPVANGAWGYPLAGGYSKGRGFGANPVHGCSYCTEFHPGYDMSQACGVTVYAAGPGRVITAGSYFGYGNAVRIDHGAGLVTLYGHMAWNSLRVAVGADVVAGTALGAEGDTGHSFGCHLHFEVRQNGVAIDPQQFMAARGLPLK